MLFLAWSQLERLTGFQSPKGLAVLSFTRSLFLIDNSSETLTCRKWHTPPRAMRVRTYEALLPHDGKFPVRSRSKSPVPNNGSNWFG